MHAHIEGVKIAGSPDGPVPVVLVGVDGEDDVVPIFVGVDEARSIARGLDATDIGRPLTHDLTLDIIEELGGRVTRVVVTELREGTFLADLHLDTPRDSTVVDCRPSDALALAARTDAPIELTDEVFEQGREDPADFEEFEDIRVIMG